MALPEDKQRERRQRAVQRWAQLKSDRSGWMTDWQELSHYLLPRSGRFNDSSASNSSSAKSRKYMHILDSTGTRALSILTAGLLSGASSPARPWFRLRTPSEDLNKRDSVKTWLWLVEERMREVFNHSNTYRCFRQSYQELACFGTAAAIVLPDFDNVIHTHPLTIGEYCVDVGEKGQVNALYRVVHLRVGQMVERFGRDVCSTAVQQLYDNNKLNNPIAILHVIEPRRERDPGKIDNLNMPYASVYYELGSDEKPQLRESGYNKFPVVAPRWETRGGDIYGASPGMTVIGDVKQLQHQQLRKSQVIDFKTLPPLALPPGAQAQGVSLAPGSINYVDVGTSGAKSLIEADMRLDHLQADLSDVRTRIDRGLYVDLFLMLMNDMRQQPITAREVAERHEEKLLMLGPVLESLHDEFLGPYIELAFDYMMSSDLIPPPPEELQGSAVTIQFVSLLAQAQRMVGLSNLERLVGSVSQLAAVKPDIIDKLDLDKAVEVYADQLGTDPTLIVSDEQVAEIRQQRAEEQQRQQRMAEAQQAAQYAKDMGAAGAEGIEAAAQAVGA